MQAGMKYIFAIDKIHKNTKIQKCKNTFQCESTFLGGTIIEVLKQNSTTN